jgi:hypothetical protein
MRELIAPDGAGLASTEWMVWARARCEIIPAQMRVSGELDLDSAGYAARE